MTRVGVLGAKGRMGVARCAGPSRPRRTSNWPRRSTQGDALED